MGDIFVRQAILHGIIAAGFVEAVLAAWRIRSAGARAACWSVALAVPFVLSPALLMAAPIRLDDQFVTRWALFASGRWDAVRVAGLGAATAAFGTLGVLGAALFLRDALPFVARLWRERRDTAPPSEVPARLAELVRAQAAHVGMTPPAVRVLRTDEPLLFVQGAWRYTLVLSTLLLERLPYEQLEAAVAHELSHVRSRDPAFGWVLMVARVLMFWNPAVQLVARAVAQEAEHRADAVAVRVAGASAFASAFDELSAPTRDTNADSLWRAFVARMHREHLSARSAALSAEIVEPAWLGLRVTAVAGALAGILFFVV